MDALAYGGAAAQGPMLGIYIERGGSLGYPAPVSRCWPPRPAGAVLVLAMPAQLLRRASTRMRGRQPRRRTCHDEYGAAMVFEGPGKPLERASSHWPALEPGELLVEVACTTLCGSDLHTYQGRRQTPAQRSSDTRSWARCRLPPGPGPLDLHGNPVAVGDRITWSIAASCGGCFYCGHELPQKCESLFKYGHEPIAARHPLSGGLSQYCHLARGTSLVRLPEHLPDEVACPPNCATATVAAALRVARRLSRSQRCWCRERACSE